MPKRHQLQAKAIAPMPASNSPCDWTTHESSDDKAEMLRRLLVIRTSHPSYLWRVWDPELGAVSTAVSDTLARKARRVFEAYYAITGPLTFEWAARTTEGKRSVRVTDDETGSWLEVAGLNRDRPRITAKGAG